MDSGILLQRATAAHRADADLHRSRNRYGRQTLEWIIFPIRRSTLRRRNLCRRIGGNVTVTNGPLWLQPVWIRYVWILPPDQRPQIERAVESLGNGRERTFV